MSDNLLQFSKGYLENFAKHRAHVRERIDMAEQTFSDLNADVAQSLENHTDSIHAKIEQKSYSIREIQSHLSDLVKTSLNHLESALSAKIDDLSESFNDESNVCVTLFMLSIIICVTKLRP